MLLVIAGLLIWAATAIGEYAMITRVGWLFCAIYALVGFSVGIVYFLAAAGERYKEEQ